MLRKSFPLFHRLLKNCPVENAEKVFFCLFFPQAGRFPQFYPQRLWTRKANYFCNKVGFPLFHRHYYYYYLNIIYFKVLELVKSDAI